MKKGIGRGVLLFAAGIAFQVQGQPAITQNPQDRAAAYGSAVSFSVAAQGTGPLHYQWQFNGDDLPRATGRTLSFLATPTRAGTYAVRVTDASGAQSSAPAHLLVQRRPAVTLQPKNTVVGVHGTAVFETTLNDSGPYTRIIWHNANPLEGSHEIPPNIGFVVDQPTLRITDCQNTDSYNGLYWIAVTNSVGGTVSRRAKLTVVGPPRLTAEPQDRTVRAGGSARFAVTIAPDAAPPKTCQWYKDGGAIAGATRRSLLLSHVQPGDQGNYYCVVTSIGGSTASWGAVLTVTTP